MSARLIAACAYFRGLIRRSCGRWPSLAHFLTDRARAVRVGGGIKIPKVGSRSSVSLGLGLQVQDRPTESAPLGPDEPG